MDEKGLALIHEVRSHLDNLKDLIHFYMSSDKRYQALLEVELATGKAGKLWNYCVDSCGENYEADAVRCDGNQAGGMGMEAGGTPVLGTPEVPQDPRRKKLGGGA